MKYGSKVYTDESYGYNEVRYRFVHHVVNHSETYVKGQVHTQGIENFWSLLKRTLRGTYVAGEPFHLDRYLVSLVRSEDEQSNSKDYQQMHRLKNSFKHRTPPGGFEELRARPRRSQCTESIRRMLLREGLSCRVLPFSSVSSLISFTLIHWLRSTCHKHW